MQTRAQAEEESGSLYGASPGSLESVDRAAWLLAHPHSLGNPGFNRERKKEEENDTGPESAHFSPLQQPPPGPVSSLTWTSAVASSQDSGLRPLLPFTHNSLRLPVNT